MPREPVSTASSTDTALPDIARYQRALEGVMGAAFTHGNRIDVLENGRRIFPAMLDAIAAARHSIDFLTFIYWHGDIAERFCEALAERAEAGVRVRILLDGFGAQPMSKAMIERLEAAGAEVAWFRPPVRWRVWQVDNRTHRKVLICDDRVGFTGGVGIAEEWEGDARDPGEWRETHFRITGAACWTVSTAIASAPSPLATATGRNAVSASVCSNSRAGRYGARLERRRRLEHFPLSPAHYYRSYRRKPVSRGPARGSFAQASGFRLSPVPPHFSRVSESRYTIDGRTRTRLYRKPPPTFKAEGDQDVQRPKRTALRSSRSS